MICTGRFVPKPILSNSYYRTSWCYINRTVWSLLSWVLPWSSMWSPHPWILSQPVPVPFHFTYIICMFECILENWIHPYQKCRFALTSKKIHGYVFWRLTSYLSLRQMLFYKGAHADRVCNDELQTKAKNIVRLINANKCFCRHQTETPCRNEGMCACMSICICVWVYECVLVGVLSMKAVEQSQTQE